MPQDHNKDKSQASKRTYSSSVLAAALTAIGTAGSALVSVLFAFADSSTPKPPGLTPTIAIFGAFAGSIVAAAAIVPFLGSARKVRKGPSDPEPSIKKRIEGASKSLAVAADLVNELEAEMQARTKALERLQAENEEYEKLAAVRKEEAEAVSRYIETVITTTHAKLGRTNRRDQTLFFVLGLLASIPAQILVNLLA